MGTEKLVNEGEMSPQISLNTFTCVYNYQTMRVIGLGGRYELHILVDSGKTYGFLDRNTV